jgi:OmcA/MtrC family decaheme c-type cytochrome
MLIFQGTVMFNARRVVPLFFVFSVLAIAGCSGDNGKDGAAGPTGPGGPPGPPGTNGGSALPVDSAAVINVETTNVDVPAGGGAPTVYLTLTNDLGLGLKGLPASDLRFTLAQLTPGTNGGSSEWQNYFTTSSGGIPNAQGTTETATAGNFVDNGDGTYEYTFANDLTAYPGGPVFDATKTHRLGIEIRGPAATVTSNGIYDFVPAGGAPTFTRKIVDNAACDACHDRLEFHGGPRTDVAYCVTCHNPHSIDGDTGNTVDMKALIHNIHSGRDGYVIIGHGGSVNDFSDVVWTQDIRNCQTCHRESDANTPQASNYRLFPNRAACGTCHYDDGDPNNGEHDYAIEAGMHPGGLSFTDDSQCVDCHGPNATINNGDVQIVAAHTIPEAVAGQAFEYKVISITNTAPGQIPTATIRVLNPTDPSYAANPLGTAYDINDPAGPFQTASARLTLDIAWTTSELGNIDPNDTLGRSPTSGQPFAPITIDFKTGATNDGSNTFTKAASMAVPTGITGSGLASLEGRPQVLIDGTLTNIAVTSSSMAFAITDATAQARRSVVDINKCDDCHKTLSLHGNNRTGNTELCSSCHNPNATDVQRRVAGSACEAELGLDDEGIDLKYMVHRIHSGNIGICGFGNSANPFFDVVFPGHLNNCEACHKPGTYYPVDPGTVMATTINVGADWSSLADDVAISPNTSVCSGCHTTDLARQHMIQNGGDFAAGKDETGALISSGVETCELCHGEGRVADVEIMHHISDYQYN